MKGVLFLCVANSARSQLAEGLARSILPSNVKVWSAGSRPTRVRPEAIAVLAELGIDISAHRSKAVSEIPAAEVDTVITLCGEEECPVFFGQAQRLHWPIPDPATDGASVTHDERLARFRAVRDTLERLLSQLAVDEMGRWPTMMDENTREPSPRPSGEVGRGYPLAGGGFAPDPPGERSERRVSKTPLRNQDYPADSAGTELVATCHGGAGMPALITRPARKDDLRDVVGFIEAASLPTAGVADYFPDAYVVAYDGNTLVATAGLEEHGGAGLLRSVAVEPSHRSAGLGRRLVDRLLHTARARGLTAVYLLTTTAPEYFARFGFARILRAEAPEPMQHSSEFASVCPASAVCMMKVIS